MDLFLKIDNEVLNYYLVKIRIIYSVANTTSKLRIL